MDSSYYSSYDNVVCVLLALERQLYSGCEHDDCNNPFCATFQKARHSNTSRTPMRQHTRLSARSLALSIASKPNPRNHLCPEILKLPPLDALGPAESLIIDQASLAQVHVTSAPVHTTFETRSRAHLPPPDPAVHLRDTELSRRPLTPDIVPSEAGKRWILAAGDEAAKAELKQWLQLWNTPLNYQLTFFRSCCFHRMHGATLQVKQVRRAAGMRYWDNPSWKEKSDDSIVRALGLMGEHKAAAPIDKFQREYLSLHVGRETVLEDGIKAVSQIEPSSILRPLRVDLWEFGVERPADIGGPGQEFFHIFFETAIRSDSDFFRTLDSGFSWFVTDSRQSSHVWESIGKAMALGVHNGYQLPLRMPLAFYYKLAGVAPSKAHDYYIEDAWPAEFKLFKNLLEAKTDAEVADMSLSTVYNVPGRRDFETRDVDLSLFDRGGVRNTRQPLPDGDFPTVTNRNKHWFVSHWLDWELNTVPGASFEHFREGFVSVIPSEILQTVTPHALRDVFEGNPTLDVKLLRRHTKYTACQPTDRLIMDFWTVFEELPASQQRQLLQFVTGSPRLPAGDTTAIDFSLTVGSSKITEDNPNPQARYPNASVCNRQLTIPPYRDIEMLRVRLLTALKSPQSFGNA